MCSLWIFILVRCKRFFFFYIIIHSTERMSICCKPRKFTCRLYIIPFLSSWYYPVRLLNNLCILFSFFIFIFRSSIGGYSVIFFFTRALKMIFVFDIGCVCNFNNVIEYFGESNMCARCPCINYLQTGTLSKCDWPLCTSIVGVAVAVFVFLEMHNVQQCVGVIPFKWK